MTLRGPSRLALAGVVACSAASTATVPNYAGTYGLYLVNGTNGCDLPGLTQGGQTSAVPLVVSQSPTIPQDMTVCLGGVAPTLLGAVGDAGDAGDACPASDLYSTALLLGTVGGSSVTLTAQGTVGAGCDGGGDAGCAGSVACAYTTNASLSLNFVGSTVQGTMTYSVSNLAGPACAAISGCQSIQAVAGVIASDGGCDGACDAGGAGDAPGDGGAGADVDATSTDAPPGT